jgi:hypothetical protein
MGYGACTCRSEVTGSRKIALKRSAWRYIGRNSELRPRRPLHRKAIFGMDTRMEGMVYAIEHPPVLGGKVKSHDDTALQVAGAANRCIDPFQPPPAFHRWVGSP